MFSRNTGRGAFLALGSLCTFRGLPGPNKCRPSSFLPCIHSARSRHLFPLPRRMQAKSYRIGPGHSNGGCCSAVNRLLHAGWKGLLVSRGCCGGWRVMNGVLVNISAGGCGGLSPTALHVGTRQLPGASTRSESDSVATWKYSQRAVDSLLLHAAHPQEYGRVGPDVSHHWAQQSPTTTRPSWKSRWRQPAR